MRRLLLTLACLPFVAHAETEQPTEAWQAKGQATYIGQHSSSFRSPYNGRNSLNGAGEDAYTFTSTAFLGARLWQGGEAYLNIEAGQGDAMSGLTGLGGFTNGEATRASGNQLKIYRQRAFVRQTWALGQDTEYQESDFNQMAGHVAKDRFVLTVGNFSVLDIFDDNAYAKDPRTQFMNWANMAPIAYDYAADARGFGWGFAGEWYQDNYVLRFGRMTGPKVPNGLPIDYRIGKYYGDQIELERQHMLGDQPGKVRLLAWRNRAQVARYSDASRWLANNPGPDQQAILNVREGARIKYGLVLNLEQAVTADLGVFLRLSRSDGRTETYAFTEADSGMAAGFALKGSAWGRPDDTFGLAWMRNGLSKDRRNYLAQGGISFFIGDGQLNYRAENSIETYYSLQATRGLWLSAGYQRIANPGYNADRGPAAITSLRAHAEF